MEGQKMGDYTMICCVVNMGMGSHVMKVAKSFGAQGGTIFLGHGIIQSRLPKIFGLNEVRKEIVNLIVEKAEASNVLMGICKDMKFEKPHHGIAFSLTVKDFTGITSHHVANNNAEILKKEYKSMYNILYVIVDKGMAEDVVDAACKAGARGGSIINARGSGIHEAQKLFSIEVEPEKEIAFFIIKSDIKNAIVESIRENIKVDEPGKGIMFVMDIDEAYGLHEG